MQCHKSDFPERIRSVKLRSESADVQMLGVWLILPYYSKQGNPADTFISVGHQILVKTWSRCCNIILNSVWRQGAIGSFNHTPKLATMFHCHVKYLTSLWFAYLTCYFDMSLLSLALIAAGNCERRQLWSGAVLDCRYQWAVFFSAHLNWVWIANDLPEHTSVKSIVLHLCGAEPNGVSLLTQPVTREDDGLLGVALVPVPDEPQLGILGHAVVGAYVAVEESALHPQRLSGQHTVRLQVHRPVYTAVHCGERRHIHY